MAEIIADNISIVETNELERFSRIDAEYYQPKYEKIIINFFHPFGAKFVLFFYSGGFTPCYMLTALRALKRYNLNLQD